MTPQMTMPDSGVKVRLYNPGFGDCILLAFHGNDDRPRYMLIDCGIHHTYSTNSCPDREERMKRIANDIKEATGGNLHVVAVTHEHTDHVYGFKYGRECFDEMTIHELWLPWTEDPDNKTAQQLKQTYGLRLQALSTAFTMLEAAGHPFSKSLMLLPDFEPVQLGAYGGKADQIQYLKDKSVKKLVRPEDYLNPQDIVNIKDVDDVRVYVLGPPTKVKWIKSLERKSELYPEMALVDEGTSFESAVLTARKMEEEGDGRRVPFTDVYGVSVEEAERDDFFIKYYGFQDGAGQGERWRRIDFDWLRTAEYLALDLNAKTNNTSLVLAIELYNVEPSKVLLFAADAQVGNWLSWQELEWSGHNLDISNVNDLLERTVLYKVGHHGSHNATLSQRGLERMACSELVAMIPVDSQWAYDIAGWKHPAKNLLKQLVKRCRGRVIRSDKIPQGDATPTKPKEATYSEWQQFLHNLEWDTENGLWIQFTIP